MVVLMGYQEFHFEGGDGDDIFGDIFGSMFGGGRNSERDSIEAVSIKVLALLMVWK